MKNTGFVNGRPLQPEDLKQLKSKAGRTAQPIKENKQEGEKTLHVADLHGRKLIIKCWPSDTIKTVKEKIK